MSVKSKLRHVLKDLLFRFPKTHHFGKDLSLERQLINNLVLEADEAPKEINTGSIEGCIRILARDGDNARDIAHCLKKHKHELGIRSIFIADRAVNPPRLPTKHSINVHKSTVIIKFSPISMLKSVLSQSPDCPDYFRKDIFEGTKFGKEPERVVIDFSSPNIAKPFHFGHLKSTILGNYLANINRYLGNHVTKLNYIGDWGTQYGLLNLGLQEAFNGDVSDVSSKLGGSPLRYLLNIYVEANKKALDDDSFHSRAKEKFLQLETDSADSMELKLWSEIRNLSFEELKSSYSGLGIEFDAYEYESNYARAAKELVQNELANKSFIRRLEDGVIVADLRKNDKVYEVPLLKSDGSSLYLTRDLCAAISRYNRYNFDKMLYVVGGDQERHFHYLGELVKSMNYEWNDRLVHVKMGKVIGMSSRAGEAVLLNDIIHEATERYIESTKNTPTTKVNGEKEAAKVGKHLALTALFVYDMRNSRTKNYKFDWESVMMVSSRGGINLQTSFARLDSLIRKASLQGLEPMGSDGDWNELHPDAICCLDGVNLLNTLLELDTALHKSFWIMDPAPLVDHGLKLSRAINKARRASSLMIMSEEDDKKAVTRLTMFKSAHKQMEFIIKLLGLTPLKRV